LYLNGKWKKKTNPNKPENIHAFWSMFCPHFYMSQSVITFYLSTKSKRLLKKDAAAH